MAVIFLWRRKIRTQKSSNQLDWIRSASSKDHSELRIGRNEKLKQKDEEQHYIIFER